MYKIYLFVIIPFFIMCSSNCAISVQDTKLKSEKTESVMALSKNESLSSAQASVEKKINDNEQIKTVPTQEVHEVKRTVTATNGITKDMTGFPYFPKKKVYPDVFNITINTTDVALGQQIACDIIDNKLVISYYAEFNAMGTRKSSKKYIYSLSPDIKTVTVSYDWQNNPRIILDCKDAQLLATEDCL